MAPFGTALGVAVALAGIGLTCAAQASMGDDAARVGRFVPGLGLPR